MTIQEFLTARLDEAEATTRRQDERWYVCNDGHVATPTAQEVDGTDHLPNHHNTWDVMYDPEWVRADIAAKRAIIHQHGIGDGGHECPDGFMNIAETEPHTGFEVECKTLRYLASVYADHPDYDPAWRVATGPPSV